MYDLKKSIFFIAICLFCFACGAGKEAPEIEESKLVPLLVDVHIAEVAIQDATATAKDSIAELWYGYVFKQHGVEQESFEQTMRALRKDPKRIGKLYEKVQEELDKRK
ncbi:MAG: DUF4296 domain-containing protein [Saprospiraceae bacterium]|nr:DUF4296 domain-containing protein [Saprospiraceae bacterium]MDZ4706358.1 DUF4296 domain-containing protein [Saprospiraceae bacterium]